MGWSPGFGGAEQNTGSGAHPYKPIALCATPGSEQAVAGILAGDAAESQPAKPHGTLQITLPLLQCLLTSVFCASYCGVTGRGVLPLQLLWPFHLPDAASIPAQAKSAQSWVWVVHPAVHLCAAQEATAAQSPSIESTEDGAGAIFGVSSTILPPG